MAHLLAEPPWERRLRTRKRERAKTRKGTGKILVRPDLVAIAFLFRSFFRVFAFSISGPASRAWLMRRATRPSASARSPFSLLSSLRVLNRRRSGGRERFR